MEGAQQRNAARHSTACTGAVASASAGAPLCVISKGKQASKRASERASKQASEQATREMKLCGWRRNVMPHNEGEDLVVKRKKCVCACVDELQGGRGQERACWLAPRRSSPRGSTGQKGQREGIAVLGERGRMCRGSKGPGVAYAQPARMYHSSRLAGMYGGCLGLGGWEWAQSPPVGQAGV